MLFYNIEVGNLVTSGKHNIVVGVLLKFKKYDSIMNKLRKEKND